MVEWHIISSRKREIVSEGGKPLPPHPSCGGLKKGIDDKSLKIHHEPLLRRSIKPINWFNMKNNTKRPSSNKTSIICHCCKRRGQKTFSC
jgi:hypothetical protein